MIYYYILIAVVVGFLLPIQGALNSKLGNILHHPMYSSLVSYIGGFITCIVVLLILRPVPPDVRTITNIDWHLFTGGILGAVFVSSMSYIIPKVGVANMLSAAIVGQLIMSVILDHYGFLDNPKVQINLTRIVGGGFLVTGLFLIQYSPELFNNKQK